MILRNVAPLTWAIVLSAISCLTINVARDLGIVVLSDIVMFIAISLLIVWFGVFASQRARKLWDSETQSKNDKFSLPFFALSSVVVCITFVCGLIQRWSIDPLWFLVVVVTFAEGVVLSFCIACLLMLTGQYIKHCIVFFGIIYIEIGVWLSWHVLF